MATIALSALGRAAGTLLLGPLGAVIGQAAGGLLGAAVDSTLIRSGQGARGPRLSDLDVQTSTEGKAIPRVYGRARIAGQVIWATRYEEETVTSGGKGGPKAENYKYYGNFAVGLCEGPIDRIGRVWADGTLLDLETVTMRVHLGTEDQAPDSLILARQGTDVPAYRGLAYVVFERLPLDDFGNRLPQLTFEVIRVVDTLERKIRGVTLIPGSTEFGYATTAVTRTSATAVSASDNRHALTAPTDLVAALDELQAVAPNLRRISLVCAWFGDDLRVGSCTVKPKVDVAQKSTAPLAWSVGGLTRTEAETVSLVAGVPAYGGTPADATVVEAIQEIRRRGLEVMLAPFIMMDVPAGNGRPDPYGAAEQAAFPWRGRITTPIAPGRVGTEDKTAAAESAIAHFVGTATSAQFSVAGGAVAYSGPPEWTYRRLIHHYAALAQAAGGVDAFLIGSELVGLTTLRSDASTYPFVTALVALAGEVKARLGTGTKITYAADWTEWRGHQPADGTGDVHFHLDPLWSSPSIDVIGIDMYAPLADWRPGDHLDRARAETPYDLDYLADGIAGGEGFDWYYASEADRRTQARTPITDGTYGEPWVYRVKDLVAWWSNRHYDRPGGVRASSPTDWTPGAKPIWFCELGCPAVDNGANQPNVFPDPKSAENAIPHFSSGARDDLAQRRTLEAVLRAYDPADTRFRPALNPVSTVYGGRMLDPAGIHLWTWDARPYPAFPAQNSIWADATNWATGHWLNGRLGGTSLEALIRAILADHGFSAVAFDAVAGHLDGYVIDDRLSARDALEPLCAAFLVDAVDAGTVLRFAGRRRKPVATLTEADCLDEPNKSVVEVRRTADAELPREVAVTFSDALLDFRRTTLSSRRLEGAATRTATADLALIAPVGPMSTLANAWLRDVWAARETLSFALGPDRIGLEPGDIVDVESRGRTRRVLIEKIETGLARRIEAHTVDPDLGLAAPASGRTTTTAAPAVWGAPLVRVLDIPHADADGDAFKPYLAAFAEPWPGSLAIWRDRGDTVASLGTVERRATMGVTASAFAPGPVARWDTVTTLDVTLYGSGTLAGLSDALVLGGGNRAAVRFPNGRWELFQFARAELVATATWRLSRLLRAQAGSEDAWDAEAASAPAGADFVLLDSAVTPVGIGRDDLGLPVTLRVGPAQEDYTRPSFTTLSLTPSGRGLLPPSPTAIRGRRDPASGAALFSWIRRSRSAGADSWATVDAPLGEEAEAYRLDILDAAGAVVRSMTTSAPSATYPAADEIADFGAVRDVQSIRVAQLSVTAGAGIARTAMVRL